MNRWKSVVTNKGLEIISNLTSEQDINIVRIKCGSGKVEESELTNQADVTGYQCDIPITESQKVNETTFQVTGKLENANITEGFKLTQIGLYCTLGDNTTEYLYQILQCTDEGDVIPSYDASKGFKVEYNVNMTFNNSENIIIEVVEDGMATKEYVDNAIKTVGRPYILISAPDTPDDIKEISDFVCTENPMQSAAIINNAIMNCLPDGGIIQLAKGTFNIAQAIGMNNANVTIQGYGENTKIALTNGYTGHVFGIGTKGDLINFSVNNLIIERASAGITVPGNLLDYTIQGESTKGGKITVQNVQYIETCGTKPIYSAPCGLISVGGNTGLDTDVSINNCLFSIPYRFNIVGSSVGNMYVTIVNSSSNNELHLFDARIAVAKSNIVGCCNIYDTRQDKTIIVVASSTATDIDKAKADYICDGESDEVEINNAIYRLSNGGVVQLLQGTFVIENEIRIENSGVTIQGLGNSTKIDATEYEPNLIFGISNCDNITIKNITIDADYYNTAGYTPSKLLDYYYWSGDGGSNITLENVNFSAYISDHKDTYTLISVGDDAGDIYFKFDSCVFNISDPCKMFENYEADENGIGKDIRVLISNCIANRNITIDSDELLSLEQWGNGPAVKISNSCGFFAINEHKTFIMVAASNSTVGDKLRANYICTGSDDHIIINTALNQLDNYNGGEVRLLPGTYNIGGSTSNDRINLNGNKILSGCGQSTIVVINPNSIYGIFVYYGGIGNCNITKIKDMHIIDNGLSSSEVISSAISITISGGTPTTFIDNVIFQAPNRKQIIYINTSDVICFIRNCSFFGVGDNFEYICEGACTKVNFLSSCSLGMIKASKNDDATIAGCINIE